MIDPALVQRFLVSRRIAVVGASDDKSNFGGPILRAFLDHGYEAVPVNPHATVVAGQPCYPDLGAVPGTVDGVVVMVPAEAAVAVIDAAADRDVPLIWLFKGLGARGAMSDEAVDRCRTNGLDVVAGACPLMFLEPVGAIHRIHRAVRRLNGSVAKAA
jgi:uncharacterized protein